MAIFKRYNTRRKRAPRGLILWSLCIIAIFVATAIFGYSLGQKAKGGENLLPSENGNHSSGITLAPIAERSVHGEYSEPFDVSDFRSDDPLALVSTWIYKDSASLFATETDKLLGKKTADLAKLNEFQIEAATSGFFEVTSIYADEKVRDIVETYELSLIEEFESNGPDEIVLVFSKVSAENYEDVFAFAEKVNGTKLICVPYALLKDEICARFFTEAAEKQLTVALMAGDLKQKQFTEDIENYAFYFTKYNIRMVLLGIDDYLLDVLKENNILNYQFYSAKEGD